MEAVTVSALTKYLQAKFSRDIHLQQIKLRGELSNVKFHNRGHCYFTLKDAHARINGVIFSQILQTIDISEAEIIDGQEVEIEGSVQIYETTGMYQIYVQKITQSGIGILQKEYQKLQLFFEQQGYFDTKHKKEVPKRVHRLALITASDGAAIEDMKKSIAIHLPHVTTSVFSTLVQGENAPKSIASAIAKAEKEHFDAIIVGRGGGSLEDLWAFNTIEVIEAIFNAQTPIISAVGHEVDIMLSDYVADFRAATPTGAIYYFDSTETLINDIKVKKQLLKEKMSEMLQLSQQLLQISKLQLKELDPKHHVERKKGILQMEIFRLQNASPKYFVKEAFRNLNEAKTRLQNAYQQILENKKALLSESENQIHLLNPQAQLQRGYALVYQSGRIVSQTTDVKQEDILKIQLSNGKIYAKVVQKHGQSENGNV